MTFFGPDIRNGLPIGLGSVAGFGRRAFTPSVLFAAGEQGFWYDPSDLSSMYQDSAGTTPVTAVEQAVGLILDKSKGLVQSQFSTNDNFASGATGWSAQSGWSVGTGSASVNSSAGTTLLRTSATSVAGRAYIISFVVSSYTSGLFRAVAGTAFAGTASATGTYTFIVFSNGGAGAGIWADSTNTVGTITSLSIRELAGNHAIQPGATNRPILRSRYNLLTYSEQFDNAAWTKFGAGTGSAPVVTPNAATAPDGTTTADLIVFDRGAGNTISDQSRLNQGPTIVSGTYTQYVWLKAATGGDVGKQLALRNAEGTGYGVVTLTADWVRYTRTETGSTANWEINNRGTITADNSVSAHVWGADLRRANDTYLPYQRIGASTDYDTVGFPVYLAFDGSDDSLYTGGNLDLSGTDRVTVFAGVTKLSDAAVATLAELSASINTNAFDLQAPSGAATPTYRIRSAGTSLSSVTVNNAAYAAPVTNVITATSNISGDSVILRADGVQVGSSTADQGTGNFDSQPLYVGRRNNASLPFNGRLYQLIVRGTLTSDALVTQAERWVAQKQGRTL